MKKLNTFIMILILLLTLNDFIVLSNIISISTIIMNVLYDEGGKRR